MKAQRLRFRYRLTQAALTLNHRDIVNAWIAAVTDAGCRVAYSQGKRPSPQVSLGAPLPQGVTTDCEYVDVHLEEPVDPALALPEVSRALPEGIEAVGVTEMSAGGPSLQTQVRWADYEVTVPLDGAGEEQIESAIRNLLATSEFPFEYRTETRAKRFDLRPLLLAVSLQAVSDESATLRMRLKAEPEATARADQVIQALGLPPPCRVHRLRLYLSDVPAVIAAYRLEAGG